MGSLEQWLNLWLLLRLLWAFSTEPRLKRELFQKHQAARHPFKVVQDFSQNFAGIHNSFNEMRMVLFHTVVANPMLFVSCLSWIKYQLCDFTSAKSSCH
jgi:hypothetical protein